MLGHWRVPVERVDCAIGMVTSASRPTKKFVLTLLLLSVRRWSVIDVAVIEDPAAAEAALDPHGRGCSPQLAEPRSATMLAARSGLPRQKVNYHLRTLERHGLVELVEERRKGNVTERVMRATAASYVISPAALAAVAPDPARAPDRLSARWLLALAAQLVRDVGDSSPGRPRREAAAGHVRHGRPGAVRLRRRPGRVRRGARRAR